MRGCYIHPKTGEIEAVFSFPNSSDIEFEKGKTVIQDIPDDVDLNWFYSIEKNQFIKKGECPSINHKWDPKIHEWVIDEPTLVMSIRYQRDTLLSQSDWTQLPDVPLSTKQYWAAYRQSLRDITEQPEYPFNVVWPSQPI